MTIKPHLDLIRVREEKSGIHLLVEQCGDKTTPRRLKPNIRLCVQDTARKLHSLIDKVDEDRYDLATKVRKADKEVKFRGAVGGSISVAGRHTVQTPCQVLRMFSSF